MTTLHILQSAVNFPVAIQVDVPPPANPGCRNFYPFTVFLSAEDNNEHIVNLYAEYSGSSPRQEPQNKWSHLIPQWRFTDLSGNAITELVMPAGSAVSAQFYFIDDMPVSGCNPVLLWLVVDFSNYPVWYDSANCSTPVSGFANSKVGAVVPYAINGSDPTNLNVTRDGKNDMFPLYWINAAIPHVVTLEDDYANNVCPLLCCEGFLHYLPETNALGLAGGPVVRSVPGIPVSALTWSPLTGISFLSALDSDYFNVGGYLRGYVESINTIPSTVIAASATVIYSPQFKHLPYLWISNPENSSLNRIWYPCVPQTITDEVTSYFESEKFVTQQTVLYNTPYITEIPIDNPMGLSGFGGIYGIAVDPCYNAWTTDSEMDALFKFSAEGSLVSSIYLAGLSSSFIPSPSSVLTVPLSTTNASYSVVAVEADDNFVYVGSSRITPGAAWLEVYDKNFHVISGLILGNNHIITSMLKYKNYLIFVFAGDFAPIGSAQVIDVSNPYAPVYVCNFNASDNSVECQIEGDTLYLLEEHTNRLHIYSLTSLPSSVTYIGYIPIPVLVSSNIPKFYVKNNILYFNNGRVFIGPIAGLTFTTLSSSVTAKTLPLNSSKILVLDNYLYTQSYNDKLNIYDVTNLSSPVLVSNTNIDYDGRCIREKKGHLFTSALITSVKLPQTLQYSYLSSYNSPSFVSNILLSAQPADIALTQFGQDTLWIITSRSFGSPYFRFFEVSLAVPPYEGATPAGISLDKQANMWVALFDNTRVLKFNKEGTLVTTINPGGINPPYYPINLSLTGIDPQFKPTLAETDKDSNVWVSYTNTLCSCLFKYDSLGYGPCATITLPTCSSPMDLFIDFNNNLWVTLTYHSGPDYRLGWVRKYSNTTMVSSFTAVHPEYLTMDLHGNLWFTQNFNTVTKITTAGTTSNIVVGNGALYPWTTAGELLEYNALEGLAADVYNRVFVINSIENELYQIIGASAVPLIKINPDYNTTWYNDSGFIVSAALDPDFAKSAQAFGDWTGLRWAIKYTSMGVLQVSSLMTAFLTGQSVEFSIQDNRGYDIRRFNESWNAEQWMRELYVQPHIYNNPVLWEGLIAPSFGTDEQPQPGLGDGGGAFGRAAYERIANFVNNHANIDVSTIDALYSMAQETDTPIDDYGLSYPAELKRLMDIFSVGQQRLWGARCPCNQNIENTYKSQLSAVDIKLISPSKPCCPATPSTIHVINSGTWVDIDSPCEHCGHSHPGNRGEIFNPLTYMVTAYTPFIVKDIYFNSEYLMVVPTLSCYSVPQQVIPCQTLTTQTTCISVFPLSASYYWVLPNTYITGPTANYAEFVVVANRYCFYEYVTVPCRTQIAGVINWDDQYTTLDEHVSGAYEWYGANQLIEKMLNYVLHKGLGLIEE